MLAYFRKQLRARGAVVLKLHGSSMQMPGLPDLLCLYRGSYTWIELKVKGQDLSKIQEHRAKELREAGATVEVFYARGDDWKGRVNELIGWCTPYTNS